MMNDNSNQTSIPSANTMWLCTTSSCVKLMNLCNIIEVYSPTCPAGSTCLEGWCIKATKGGNISNMY